MLVEIVENGENGENGGPTGAQGRVEWVLAGDEVWPCARNQSDVESCILFTLQLDGLNRL